MVAEVLADTAACAISVPAKREPVPRVAELPTRQKTLHSWAPPVNRIVLPEPVVRVETAVKMKTSSASPCRVMVPLFNSELAEE
jgi:hypothetical protein